MRVIRICERLADLGAGREARKDGTKVVPRNDFVLCECMLTEDFFLALWSLAHHKYSIIERRRFQWRKI